MCHGAQWDAMMTLFMTLQEKLTMFSPKLVTDTMDALFGRQILSELLSKWDKIQLGGSRGRDRDRNS
eukprot:3325796-Ditylum_brightwellii.AAC.1